MIICTVKIHVALMIFVKDTSPWFSVELSQTHRAENRDDQSASQTQLSALATRILATPAVVRPPLPGVVLPSLAGRSSLSSVII